MPFGMDLDILFMTKALMTLDGWNDYNCKLRLLKIFRGGFWAVSGIVGEGLRDRVRATAEAASKIGVVLSMAFRRNADGSPSEEVLVSETEIEQLRAWRS